MPSNEVILVDAIKTNTTINLTQYMLKDTNGQAFELTYFFRYLIPMLKAICESIEELIIFVRPCNKFVLPQICSSPKNLCKVIILDNSFSEASKHWIQKHAPDAELCFPVPYLSKLLKSSTYKELVFDQIAFNSFLTPFKDMPSFQAIKTINIHGSFKNDDFHPSSISKFVQFINGFPMLRSLEACFTFQTESSASPLQPKYQDSYDGFAFYENMKKIKAEMFQGLSEKVHGRIQFDAKINSFESMCCSMKDNLNQSNKALKPPIEYDEKNSIIQRKFSAHDRLLIKFFISPAPSSSSV